MSTMERRRVSARRESLLGDEPGAWVLIARGGEAALDAVESGLMRGKTCLLTLIIL